MQLVYTSIRNVTSFISLMNDLFFIFSFNSIAYSKPMNANTMDIKHTKT